MLIYSVYGEYTDEIQPMHFETDISKEDLCKIFATIYDIWREYAMSSDDAEGERELTIFSFLSKFLKVTELPGCPEKTCWICLPDCEHNTPDYDVFEKALSRHNLTIEEAVAFLRKMLLHYKTYWDRDFYGIGVPKDSF